MPGCIMVAGVFNVSGIGQFLDSFGRAHFEADFSG
jgi:hypothetical protein